MYQSFNEILKDNLEPGVVPTENLDLVSPPPPAPQPGNNPPRVPQWGQSLTGRVAKLEQQMTWIGQNMATKQDLQGFATKQDLQGFATKQDITAIDQRLDRIEQVLTKRQ